MHKFSPGDRTVKTTADRPKQLIEIEDATKGAAEPGVSPFG
jgi:hypothetical protein